MPVFSAYFATDDTEEVWRLSSTVINVLFIVLSVCAVVGWLAAPYIVSLFGFPLVGRRDHAHDADHDADDHRDVDRRRGAGAAQRDAAIQSGKPPRHGAQSVRDRGRAVAVRPLRHLRIGLRHGRRAVAQLLVQLPSFRRSSTGSSSICTTRGCKVCTSSWGRSSWAPRSVRPICSSTNILRRCSPTATSPPCNTRPKWCGFPQQLLVAIATVIFPILSAQFASNELPSLRVTASAGLRMTALITLPAALG